jgi:putative DNA primase/helicase
MADSDQRLEDARARLDHEVARARRVGEDIAITRAVRDQIGTDNLLFHNATFWRWRDRGVWARIEDREVQQEIHRLLDARAFLTKFKRSTVDSVLDLLRTECYRPEHRWNTSNDGINTISGVLIWSDATKQWKRRPHRREDYAITQIPVAHAPEATAPRFLQFLEEIFANDTDAQKKAQCVLEFIGLSLITTCRFERFLLLIGGGANGKTVLLKVVESLVGPEMVCAVQPSQLDNRFQRAHLAGKLVNIVTEIAEGAEIADAQLKAIVSGELTTAEHKHRPPFDFHPFAKCWFATNHMPHSRDFSDALFRRALVLQFNQRFEGSRADPHLIEMLRGELSGILNLALEGIGCVYQRGQVIDPDSSLAAKKDWRLQCDQAAQFCEDNLQVESGASIASSYLYSMYRLWATEQGVNRMLGQKSLIQRLVARYGLELSRTETERMVNGVRQKLLIDRQAESRVLPFRQPRGDSA